MSRLMKDADEYDEYDVMFDLDEAEKRLKPIFEKLPAFRYHPVKREHLKEMLGISDETHFPLRVLCRARIERGGETHIATGVWAMRSVASVELDLLLKAARKQRGDLYALVVSIQASAGEKDWFGG